MPCLRKHLQHVQKKTLIHYYIKSWRLSIVHKYKFTHTQIYTYLLGSFSRMKSKLFFWHFSVWKLEKRISETKMEITKVFLLWGSSAMKHSSFTLLYLEPRKKAYSFHQCSEMQLWSWTKCKNKWAMHIWEWLFKCW